MAQKVKPGLQKLKAGLKTGGTGGAAPAPAPAAAVGNAGSYYSPRQFGAQKDSYAARAEAARAAMEERSKALLERQQAMEAARRQAEEAQKQYHAKKGRFKGTNAAAYEQELLNRYTTAVKGYTDSKGAYEEAHAAYSPYEEAYNRAAQEYNDYVRSEEEAYGAWKSTIRGAGDIRAEQKTVKEKRAELKQLMQLSNELSVRGQFSMLAANERRIQELKSYLGEVDEREKLLEEELEWSEHFRFEDLRQNPDFAQQSQYRSTGTAGQLQVDPMTGRTYDLGTGDRTYEYVNRNARAVGAQAMDDINNEMGHLQTMTDDEIALYNYLYATEGREAAAEYLGHLRLELTARQQEGYNALIDETVRAGGVPGAVLASAGSLLMSPISGIEAKLGQIGSWVTGQEVDPNAGYAMATNTKNAMRQSVSGMVEEKFGPAGGYLYNTGMSIADMLMDKWTGTALAGESKAAMRIINAMIAGRGFAQKVIDGKKRGLSDEQALGEGTVAAAAELITEALGRKYGLDVLLRLPEGWESAGFWRGLFKGAVGEAGEEGLTNLINLYADLTIAGEDSQFHQNIRDNMEQKTLPDGSVKTGMSREEATKEAVFEALGDFGLDMLGGAISGGAFGGYRGWQGKKASTAQKNASEEAKAPEAPEGEALPTVEDPGGQMPHQPQSDSSPTQSAGEIVAGGAGDVTDGNVGKMASAQAVQEDVQKGPELPGAEPVNENGGKANEEAGEHVLPGGTERADASGAGEPDGSYAEHRERQQTEARSQAEAAAQRRVKAENLEKRGHLQRVSSQDLGLRQGTEVQELLELPRIEWDQELYDTATRLEKEMGMTVRTVTGNIGVRLKGGGVGLAKGYIDRVNKTIVLNVCHSQVTAGQIADHELWHHKMEAVGRISGDRYQVTQLAAQRIQEQYSPEDFDEVLDAYIDGYGDVYDQSNWEEFLNRVYEEIMADAYAGMNVFGMEASKFRSTVDSTMDELGMGRNMWNAAEQEDTLAPGGDQRVYADEDAPPMPEYEDDSQVPEYDWDGWDDSMADFSIEKLPDGKKYVRADRQVIMGNDPDSWSEQVEDYINGKIRRGGDVKLLAEDGDVLLLTATTAGKLSDYHDSHGRTLSDDAFYLKASAAVHIDELAATSIKDRTKTDVDGRHDSFAAKGWQYRTAFFQDFDGKYYRVSISVAQGENENVVYNIGKIERRSHPTIDGSSAGSGALGGKTSSKNMVSRAGDNVKDSDDVRFALDRVDSEGRELSAEQREFFRDSKVRNEDGRLMVMYHGTPSGRHTTFRSGTYFTPNREYADGYQKPGASMLSSKKDASAPKTYEVYLNITKPFDTRNPRERKIFMEEYYRQWGLGAPLAKSGLPDWTDGMDLQEFIEEMGYDYDGLILDEGATGGYGLEVKSRGLSYVTFSSEQVKDVGNRNPTDDPDIRFSMDGSLSREEYERLAAEVAGDQSKRNEEFVKSRLTPEQYKQYKAFAREDRLDQEAEARVRGIERFEEAQAREKLNALRAQQAEDRAANRRELAAEEKAARAEAREKAGTAREERKRKAQEKREQLRQEARERIRRAAENAPTDSVPTIARKELQDKLIGLFSVGEGQRGELRREIGQLADRMIAEGTVDERDLRRLIDRLYESGVMVIEPEEVYAEGRSYLKDEHIYISPEQIRELGDDWLDLRKKAWGLGVYLTTDRSYAGLDVWNADMASYLPGLFNENETDSRTILERLLHIAQEGKAEKVSLPEYTKRIAKAEHQSEEALLYNMERQVEEALRTFGEKASLEMRLKNRNARRRAMDREEVAIAREADRAELERKRQELADDREALRELNEAERDRLRLQRAENDRRNAAERRRLAEERAARRRKHQENVRKKELRELQEKTLKALQWISKNRRKAPEAMQEAFNAVLGNIDLFAISMADEMNWSSKYGATWKDLKQMYLHAQATDPNFMPSKDLDLIVQRLDSVQLESMDFDQLRDLYQAAVGLRTEFYQRNNVIGSEEHEIMGELYNACVEEMRTAPKKLKGLLDRFLNLEQMTPMNVFEEMGGFNPDGALYKFAKQLEDGERKVRSFKVRSNKILADFLEDNADWIHRADGQGKDGIWIEVEIPQLIGMKVGEVPEFGGTVKVFMTPMQRVHLYLESRNYDNLRHMTGGRTFADRELYSQGKREEAFAKGTTIRMAPETVQLLVKDMSSEELELARLLDKYYNDLAATEINKVSNILLGYNKAMGGHYAPIFTNANYTKSEFGKFDGTAEGAGNLKERVKSKNPSYNISALDAFERNMGRTATYVGMAIPVRNWNTLMNWQTSNSSFADEITHSWGKGRLDYIQNLITDLQNPMGEQQDMVTEMSGKLLSNYISSVFGFNPSIVVKQLGSIPMASAYLDWKHFPKGVIGKGKIDRELIGRYTQELEWRTMGYSMPETKQLKDAPNWSQKNKAVGLVFGGDAITAMDGWAASVLWPWAENKVRAEFPGLEVGDAAMIESGQSPFYQKVAELFNDAVSRSQSVSDQMHQGRLRKSKHTAAKAVTMFRSDSAQSYNVLRQRLGELDYYRRQGEGGKVMAEAAKKAVGAAATAVLINSIWGTAVDLLVKALKGKLDEEDKEPLQIAEDFFWGVIDSYAGMVTAGDIIAEVVGGWFTGEKAYSTEAPGIEQFNDIKEAADKIINAGKKGNLIGAIKIAAETIASYGFGLPTKNVEAYLMGLFSWALPGAKVAYEDLLKAPAKADLKGLEGDALTVRLNHVLKGYGVELEPDVREALAGLYEAGYTEAVPSAAPDAVTVDGVELELDGRMKKEYDKTRGGIIEQELPEITGSAFFAQADEKTRKAMVTKLYNYAAEKAKEAVLEDYAIGTTAQAIDEIVRSGGSAADYAVFDAVTADMAAWQRAEVLQEWGTDEAVTGLMFKYLVSKSWEDEQAELRKVGVDVGQFLELYAMHGQIDSRDLKAGQKATEFAYWLDGQRYTDQQKAVIKDQMAYFQMMPADASRYNMATAAGLDREQALELTEELDALEPPEGKTSVQEIQKYRVAIDQSVSESNQLKMLQSVGLKDSSYDKVAKGYEMGVAPAAWVRVKEVQQQFDANGNGRMTQAEWEAAIEGICAYGIVLPGDNTRFNLTNEQKGVLWQMLVGKNTKSKNNPFDPAAGQRWRELMGYE